MIPEQNKLMSSFLIPKKDGVARYDWDSFAHEKKGYISFHLVKFLLIYEEIDTVLDSVLIQKCALVHGKPNISL